MVCLDEGAGVVPRDCLVYSFGVGNDFTFDTHMQVRKEGKNTAGHKGNIQHTFSRLLPKPLNFIIHKIMYVFPIYL